MPATHVRPLPTAPTDPLALLTHPDAVVEPRFYWSAYDRREIIVGFGVAKTVTASGPDRWSDVALAVAVDDELTSQALLASDDAVASRDVAEPDEPATPSDFPAAHPVPADDGVTARWLTAFAFEPELPQRGRWAGVPAAAAWLPAVQLQVDADGARLIVVGDGPAQAHASRADDLATWLAESGRVRSSDLASSGSALPASGPGSDRRPSDRRSGGPSDEPPADELVDRIRQALDAIQLGSVEKVVLAVARDVLLDAAPDPVALLAGLRARQPGCTHFLISPQPDCAWLGATPERLVRVTGGRLETMALAGSAARDPDPDRDAALGEALLTSAKDRAEHAHVVAAIRRQLGADPALGPLEIRSESRLRRLATIQHLETPIAADLARPADVLEVAARLHPTPALGGTPQDAALRLIRQLEREPRGWYGGAVGWLDGRGQGDLAVAIRSLLVRGQTVSAFAGAGIVAGSDPDAEAREIGLKLAAASGVR